MNRSDVTLNSFTNSKTGTQVQQRNSVVYSSIHISLYIHTINLLCTLSYYHSWDIFMVKGKEQWQFEISMWCSSLFIFFQENVYFPVNTFLYNYHLNKSENVRIAAESLKTLIQRNKKNQKTRKIWCLFLFFSGLFLCHEQPSIIYYLNILNYKLPRHLFIILSAFESSHGLHRPPIYEIVRESGRFYNESFVLCL